MEANSVEVSIKGRAIKVPSIQIRGRIVIVSCGWLKIASVKDEAWLEDDCITEPEVFIEKLRKEKLNADIFTFAQKLPYSTPNYCYPMELENVAAIPTTNYTYWWEHRLPQETRKNVRRAIKRGVVIREVQLNDELLQGIVEINNETPIRQGKPFWHYEKSFEQVKKDYTTLIDRSEYIGAYFENKPIGFIKMVYMGEIAAILQILCMNKHYDKRPANALIARAVEICSEKGLKYLIYGQYIYGNKSKSLLTEFKRRNGFEQVFVPRYYIPLTTKGKIVIQLRLHLGLKRLIPENILYYASKIRSKWYERTL